METRSLSLPKVIRLLPFAFLSGLLFTGCESMQNVLRPKTIWSGDTNRLSEVTTLAVMAEDKAQSRSRSQSGLVRSVEDQFIASLLRKGFQVSTRTDISQVQREQLFQRSGATDADAAAKLGRILNVSGVLLVTINGYQVTSQSLQGVDEKGRRQTFQSHTATCNMSVRLVSTEKAEVLGIATYSSQRQAENRTDLSSGVLHVAHVLANSIPPRPNKLKVSAKIN
jgi:curli biogenesis system outer membrane secretion channel CsgG